MPVIRFSQKFPKKHISEGCKTHFVEQILNQLGVDYKSEKYFTKLCSLNTVNLALGKLTLADLKKFQDNLEDDIITLKCTTIRASKMIKAGNKISPRVWRDRPFNSPNIIFWDDILVFKTIDITFVQVDEMLQIGEHNFYPFGYEETIEDLAKNDGLSVEDFKDWFKKPFVGQIICFKDVKY